MAAAGDDDDELRELESRLLEMLKAEPDGLTDAQITEAFGAKAYKQLVPVINDLSSRNRINFVNLGTGKGVLFTFVDDQIAQKLGGLTTEMMMVYEEIKQVGNNGIWNREIKQNTNIQQQILSKALKELERRMLIKSVKSIHQKTKKIWMLYDLTPSTALTGGPWYTDNEFDHEFVNEIARLVENQIREAWTEDGNPTSLQMVEEKVKTSGVSQEQLSSEHIKQILDRLVFDTKIETLVIPAQQKAVFQGNGPWYRSSPDINFIEDLVATAFPFPNLNLSKRQKVSDFRYES